MARCSPKREVRDTDTALPQATARSLARSRGNVKADNILVSSFDHPFSSKLGDFGLAERLEPGRMLTARQGTQGFIAPEMYLVRGHGTPVDIWALGVRLLLVGLRGKMAGGRFCLRWHAMEHEAGTRTSNRMRAHCA